MKRRILTEEERKARKRAWDHRRYERQKDMRKEKQRAYYARNKERIKQWHRNYRISKRRDLLE